MPPYDRIELGTVWHAPGPEPTATAKVMRELAELDPPQSKQFLQPSQFYPMGGPYAGHALDQTLKAIKDQLASEPGKALLIVGHEPQVAWLARDCSACCGDPDVAVGEFGEDVEGPAAVLGRGGQMGAHRGEVLGAGEGAQASGHLLLDLGHAEIAFGRVVVEGHPRVGGEPQVVLQAPVDAAGQGPVPAADRAGRPGLGRG